jgi:pyruvate kinase
MSRIVEAAEVELLGRGLWPLNGRKPRTQGGAVARAAAELADYLDAKTLVAFTKSGDTARRLARYRVPQPIIAFTTEAATRNQLALTWGVQTTVVPHVDTTDEMVQIVNEEMLKISEYGEGDTAVITAGSPPGLPGTTNLIRVHHLGRSSQS